MKPIVDSQLIEQTLQKMEVDSLDQLSIRQLVAVVKNFETATGQEFIHFEIGVPGLPCSRIGAEAQKAAIDRGVPAVYPSIDGEPELKQAASMFVEAVIGTHISPRSIVPTVGSMQGTYATLMAVSNLSAEKDTILYIDPGFPVQKVQADVLGIRKESFDLFDYRADKLEAKLEEVLSSGRIAALLYSTPNNPSWMCLTDDELRTIGRLASKYDVVVIEDLAYLTMDFRQTDMAPCGLPKQVSVSHYTDNYVMLLSGSKIFSYAGERIAVACISDKLFERKSEQLKRRFGLSSFGNVFVHKLIYTLSSGVSHSAQMALAEMFRLAAEGKYNYVEEIREYATRTARLREILTRHGFNVVYDTDVDQPVGDGFFFTIGYNDMDENLLLEKLLMCGISGITLASTGATHRGIRACSSAIKPHHYALLDERLTMFEKLVKN
ncbi:MAG: pyridoxal phosphate-dependent aminotransferase [Tidjanibacter sp.]|nr:pyridoxal phosphate-dependent aminotransferase [Tidjanibacter sp.]